MSSDNSDVAIGVTVSNGYFSTLPSETLAKVTTELTPLRVKFLELNGGTTTNPLSKTDPAGIYSGLCMVKVKKTGVLSDRDIIGELGRNIVIEPFSKENLGPNSYDVNLGEWYYKINNIEDMPEFFCIDNPKHIAQHWGLDPYDNSTDEKGNRTYGAQRAMLIDSEDDAKMYGVAVGDRVIVIPPSHTFLCHTQQFIGGRNSITTEMSSRSSTGRAAVCVCNDAGLGDAGFISRWTMEIRNNGIVPVVLKVGLKIAQIKFLTVTSEPLISYEKRGQYQTSSDIAEIMRTWSPATMIPSKAVEYIRSQANKLQSINQ